MKSEISGKFEEGTDPEKSKLFYDDDSKALLDLTDNTYIKNTN